MALKHTLLTAGLVEPPPRMVETIIDWVEGHWVGDETTIDTDLRGWKHLGERDWFPVTPRSTRFLPNTQQVRVVLESDIPGAGGAFYQNTRPPTITINMMGLERTDYGKRSQRLRTIVEHELRHFAQLLLQGGRPSKKIRTPAISQKPPAFQERSVELQKQLRQLGVPVSKDMFHALDDIEFYTRLADAVEDFKRQAVGIRGDDRTLAVHYFTGGKPAPTKHSLNERFEREFLESNPYGPLSEAAVRKHLQQQVKERLTTFRKFRNPHPFFYALRGATGKWRKAVGELAVAVLGGKASAHRVANRYLAARGDYPKAGGSVSGLRVKGSAPNQNSISASFNDYEVLPDVREVPVSDFNAAPHEMFYSSSDLRRVEELAEAIERNGWITPLIVVLDDDPKPYILEGAHRLAALHTLGKRTLPALVVRDLDL